MDPVSKKLKVEDNSSELFTQKELNEDGVTLHFEEKKINAPKSFLCLASPVFEATFRNELRTKKIENLGMEYGVSYEDFHELLLCIHPRILKEINEANVFRIVPLAEKYQVTAIVTKCKAAMKSMLSKAEKTASDANHNSYQPTPLKECLNVLKCAMIHNYADIIALAVTPIARFGYFMYNGVDHSKEFYLGLDRRIDDNNDEIYGDIEIVMFSSKDSHLKSATKFCQKD